MRIKKYCILLILLLFGACFAHSQENHTEICLDFRVNSMSIDSTYMDNAARIQEMVEFLRSLRQDSTLTVIKISFSGVSSPEGSYEINRKLAFGRLASLENIIRSEVDIPDSLVFRDDAYIRWDYLRSLVEHSDFSWKDEVMAILYEEARLVDYHQPNSRVDRRVIKLRELDGGKVWQWMNRHFFQRMRNACVVLVTYKKEVPPAPEPVVESDTVVVEPVVETVPDTMVVIPAPKGPSRNLYLKSNAIGWGMLIANAAAEVDLADHWSISLPVYYSALNYFTSRLKFRTLCFQPEVRYWLSSENQGWFGGAHLGVAWFIYAKGGDWRYQDHHRRTPMLGGGVSGGYRKSISSNKRWLLEFSLGCGAYKLHYDIFYNEPNGQLADTRKRTFFGIDHAAISIVYRLGSIKKGDKK